VQLLLPLPTFSNRCYCRNARCANHSTLMYDLLLLLLLLAALQVLLQYRTLRNYRTPMYVLPRLLEKLLFAAVLVSLYWGKVSCPLLVHWYFFFFRLAELP
jgi:hypothetical protein